MAACFSCNNAIKNKKMELLDVASNFIKKRCWHRYLPVNFEDFFMEQLWAFLSNNFGLEQVKQYHDDRGRFPEVFYEKAL